MKGALRKEAMRVGVIDFAAQPFWVLQSLEAVKAETTRQRDTYLRVETAQEAVGKRTETTALGGSI